jgi:hypothetical protein
MSVFFFGPVNKPWFRCFNQCQQLPFYAYPSWTCQAHWTLGHSLWTLMSARFHTNFSRFRLLVERSHGSGPELTHGRLGCRRRPCMFALAGSRSRPYSYRWRRNTIEVHEEPTCCSSWGRAACSWTLGRAVHTDTGGCQVLRGAGHVLSFDVSIASARAAGSISLAHSLAC